MICSQMCVIVGVMENTVHKLVVLTGGVYAKPVPFAIKEHRVGLCTVNHNTLLMACGLDHTA